MFYFKLFLLSSVLLSSINASTAVSGEKKSSVACEHDKLTISCNGGYNLRILNALYGRQQKSTCFREGQVSNTNCAAATALSVVQSRCNNLTECTVDASNGVFGDPCYGTFKYLEVEYQCLPSGKSSSVACEHDKLNINCNRGYHLKIVNALYGRKQKSTCFREGQVSNTNCAAATALSVVQSRCNNLTECTVDASNGMFGDPCFGTYKYLEVEYQCLLNRCNVPPNDGCMCNNRGAKTSSLACEGDKLNINCNHGYYLRILNALYGRKQKSSCFKVGLVSNTNCAAETALSVVQSRCNNLTECTVDASNGVFGDPCYGTYKYLEVEYKCLPISGGKTSSLACEGDKLNINCNHGYHLKIVNALYGRKQKSTCFKEGLVSNTNCAAATALTVVQSRCNNLPDCTVDASNGMFGDPCHGTYKYLEVEYQCLPNNYDVLLPIDIRMGNNCC